MSQIPEVLTTLKRELKSQGLTYAQVGSSLALSENSIKRVFSSSSCSLQRLEQLCELVGLDILELARKTETARQKTELLSEEQEKEIADDPKLLLVAICALNHWIFEEIIQGYKISEHECIQLLAKLDALNVIELQPLNKFKLIVANNFRWRTNGPIQRFFQRRVQPDFFRSSFANSGEKLLFQSGMLSRVSNEVMTKKMVKLVAEFGSLHEEDLSLPLEQRFGTSIVVAIRAWEFSMFRELRRNQKLVEF